MLVMVSSEPWKYHQGSIAPEQLQKQLTALRAKEKLEYVQNIQKIKEAKKKNRKAEFERQQRLIFKDVNQKRCFSVNLYEHVNMGFADEVEGDGKGGWLDQGNKDLCNLPLGKQTFSGVPFRVIDPKENDGRSCIMLYSSTRKYFPKKFSGIKVGRKATRLYFLHGSGWTVSDKVFKYIVHYSDGSTVNIPITGGKQISDWYKPVEVSDAKIGWEGRNSIFKHIGLYVYRWRNPHPKKIITKLDIVSTETPTAAGIIALTGEE